MEYLIVNTNPRLSLTFMKIVSYYLFLYSSEVVPLDQLKQWVKTSLDLKVLDLIWLYLLGFVMECVYEWKLKLFLVG